MKSRVFAVVLLLAGPWAAFAAEQPPTPPGLSSADPFDALQKALSVEHETKARAAGGGGREVYETRSYLESIRQALNRGEDSTVLNTVSQIETTATTEDVRRACVAIVRKVDKDRTAREQAYATEVDVAVKRAAEVVLHAKSPKELDGTIADFNRLAEPRPGLSAESGDNRMAQKLQGIATFLNGWQEYLDAHARGDEQAVTNALTTLGAADYSHTQIVPRSEILARLAGIDPDGSGRGRRTPAETNAAVADILEHAHTLDDLPTALGKLNDLLPRGTSGQPADASTDLAAAVAGLQAIQKLRAELQAGIATTISIQTFGNEATNARPGVEARLTGLRAELIQESLPRLLGVPDAKAAAGEGVGGFLRRLIAEAKKRGDWVAVARGIDLERELAAGQNNHTTANTQEAEAFQQYFAGLNLEAAGQYAQAVAAYLSALKTGAQELPASVVGEHLASIERLHPQAFATAATGTAETGTGPQGTGAQPTPSVPPR